MPVNWAGGLESTDFHVPKGAPKHVVAVPTKQHRTEVRCTSARRMNQWPHRIPGMAVCLPLDMLLSLLIPGGSQITCQSSTSEGVVRTSCFERLCRSGSFLMLDRK